MIRRLTLLFIPVLIVMGGCNLPSIPTSTPSVPIPEPPALWMPSVTPIPTTTVTSRPTPVSPWTPWEMGVSTSTPRPTATPQPTATPTPAVESEPSTEPEPTITPIPTPTVEPEPPTESESPPPMGKSFSDEVIQNSLVRVRGYTDRYIYTGTGVIVRYKEHEYIITANHILQDDDIERIFAGSKAYGFVRAHSVITDAESDVAILVPLAEVTPKIEAQDFGIELAQLARGDLPPATAKYFRFRNTETTALSPVASATYCGIYNYEGVIGGRYWVYDINTDAGTSGAPFTNSHGHLISIHLGTFVQGDGGGRYIVGTRPYRRSFCADKPRSGFYGLYRARESYSAPAYVIRRLLDEMLAENGGADEDARKSS